ncbi:hypothetical protein C4577_01980 [Candidatus Parcubacteria bacterium]|nr:MAG: hypothetical protein C4577_01980 [Candidatus Parcubacteria bacterium]
MELEELEQMMKDARSPKEFFGRDAAKNLKKFLGICHPDRNPGDAKAVELFKKINDWYEELETPSVVIKSPKRGYTVLKHLTSGDVSDIYLAEAANKDYLLKISRIDDGEKYLEIEKNTVADLLTKAGDSTYSKYLPTFVESFPAKDTIAKRVNVFTYDPGFYSLEQVKNQYKDGVDGRDLAWMFNRILTGLGFIHKSGYVHGAVLPSHILIHPESHGGRFCGFVHSVKIGEKVDTISVDYKSWYPKEVNDKEKVGPASDIYMAAKCAERIMREDTPRKIKNFVYSCMLESPSMRPNDAWLLYEEFKDLLSDVYGKRKFHIFTMN